MSNPSERVVFSGIQPTADSFHLGNAWARCGSGWRCRTSSTPSSASSTCTRSRSRRTRTCFGAARRDRRAAAGAGHRPGAGDLFVQSPRARAHRTRLGAGLPHRLRRGEPDDAVQGQVAAQGSATERPSACSPTRSCRRPTSCSTRPTGCPSARTSASTWSSPAISRSGSTALRPTPSPCRSRTSRRRRRRSTTCRTRRRR